MAGGEALAIALLVSAWPSICLQLVRGDDSIVFPDSVAERIKTLSAQPRIGDKPAESQVSEEVKPRFGFDTDGLKTNFDFGIRPNAGGISGSASFSSSYGGQGQNQGLTGSHSQSFNFQAGCSGFSASHAASQSSSFNSQFPASHGFGSPSITGSQASSQAASVSGGAGGGSGSAASSQASSFGVQGSGANFGASSSSANSQVFSSPLGRPGGGYGYYPTGGVSGSSSQSAGASLGDVGSYASENLPPDFIRSSQGGYKYVNNHHGRRKRPGWFSEASPLDKQSYDVYTN